MQGPLRDSMVVSPGEPMARLPHLADPAAAGIIPQRIGQGGVLSLPRSRIRIEESDLDWPRTIRLITISAHADMLKRDALFNVILQ
jgi:hypothetical protein